MHSEYFSIWLEARGTLERAHSLKSPIDCGIKNFTFVPVLTFFTWLLQLSQCISGRLLRVLASKAFRLFRPGFLELNPASRTGEANFRMKSDVIVEVSWKKKTRKIFAERWNKMVNSYGFHLSSYKINTPYKWTPYYDTIGPIKRICSTLTCLQSWHRLVSSSLNPKDVSIGDTFLMSEGTVWKLKYTVKMVFQI